MNIDQTLEQLAHLQCPRQVDVTDRVMAQVMQRPYLQPRRHSLWKPVSIMAAAAVALVLVVNVVSLYGRSYDEASMGMTLAQVNDYSSWNTIEDGALNPIEYMYDE